MTGGTPAGAGVPPFAMGTELEPRKDAEIADAEEFDRIEREALDAIETVQDPDQAERLIENIRFAEEAVRFKHLGEDQERRWRIVVLKAERRYGELLGPPTRGRENFSVTRDHAKSDADRAAAKLARKVAAVPEEKFEEYVSITDYPTRAGLLREADPPKESRKPQRNDEGAALWKDERVISWAAGRMAAGRTREDMVAESKARSHGWPVPDAHLPQNAADRLRAVVQDRQTRGTDIPKLSSWTGKSGAARLRQLQAEKRKGNYTELSRLQMEIAKMCEILKDYDIRDYDISEASLWSAADIYDELTDLGGWLDSTLLATQRWLTDREVRVKIAKLRETSGRTPEEADTALRLADRLERKLESQL